MVIQKDRNCGLKKLDPSVKIINIQHFIDKDIDFTLPLRKFPVTDRFTTSEYFVDVVFQELSKMNVSCFFYLKMLISKSHLEEVHPKRTHEEEDSKQRRKDSSDIGKHINKFEISSINYNSLP